MNALPTILVINAVLAAVLALVAVAVGALRKPSTSHAAWLLVLVKFLTPPLVVVPIVVATATPEIVETTVQQESKLQRDLPAAPELPPALTTPPMLSAELPPVEPIAFANVPLENVLPKVVDEPTPEPTRAVASAYTPPSWQTVTMGVWALGAVVFCWLLFRHIKAGLNLARMAGPADALTQAQLNSVAQRIGLRRIPQVQMIPAAISPLVWSAWWKPRIWLPATLWQTLSYEQRETILAHECAHLVHADHWVRRLEIVVLALYWWCPVAWFTARKLREFEEVRADARVLSTYPALAPAYAQALVDTVAFVVAPRWAPLASPSTTTKSSLERRLTMILSQSPKTRAWPAAVAVALGVITLPFSPGFAQAPPAKVEAPVPSENAPRPPVRYRSTLEVIPATEGENGPAVAPPAGTPAKTPRANAAEAPTLRYVESNPFKTVKITELKDELELLQATMGVKEAYVKAAERTVRATEEALMELKKAHNQGAIPQKELMAGKTAFESAQSDFDIKVAEFKEHMVKVSQVTRKIKQAETIQPNQTWIPKTTPVGGNPYTRSALDWPKPDTATPAPMAPRGSTAGSTAAGIPGGMPGADARPPLRVAGGPETPPSSVEPAVGGYSTPGFTNPNDPRYGVRIKPDTSLPAIAPRVAGPTGTTGAGNPGGITGSVAGNIPARVETIREDYGASIVKLKKQVDELTKERDELREQMKQIEKLREDLEKLKKSKKE